MFNNIYIYIYIYACENESIGWFSYISQALALDKTNRETLIDLKTGHAALYSTTARILQAQPHHQRHQADSANDCEITSSSSNTESAQGGIGIDPDVLEQKTNHDHLSPSLIPLADPDPVTCDQHHEPHQAQLSKYLYHVLIRPRTTYDSGASIS